MAETKTVFVKPAKGCKVRDPNTMAFLPDEGEEKPRSTYWLRRIRMGDVDVVEAATPSRAAPSAKPSGMGRAAVRDKDE